MSGFYDNNNNNVSALAGMIAFFAGTTAPQGWLFCDGSSYSTTTYSSLYSILGTTYGSGTGTFNVPDLRNQFVYGASTTSSLSNTKSGNSGGNVTLTAANVPSHNHTGTTNTGTAIVSAPNHSHGIYIGRNTSGNNTGEYFNSDSNSGTGGYFGLDSATTNASDSGHAHTFTTAASGNATPSSFSIMPPYMIMNYIIKY